MLDGSRGFPQGLGHHRTYLLKAGQVLISLDGHSQLLSVVGLCVHKHD